MRSALRSQNFTIIHENNHHWSAVKRLQWCLPRHPSNIATALVLLLVPIFPFFFIPQMQKALGVTMVPSDGAELSDSRAEPVEVHPALSTTTAPTIASETMPSGETSRIYMLYHF